MGLSLINALSSWPSKIPLIGLFLNLLLLVGCGTVGVPHLEPLPNAVAHPFNQALMAYAGGKLDQAREFLKRASIQSPEDGRIRILQQAIENETGEGEKVQSGSSGAPSDAPFSPEQVRELVLGQNPEILQAVYGVVVARAELREANLSFGPEVSILTRFQPAGIFASLTQSILDGLVVRPARMTQAEQRLLASLAHYARIRDSVLHRAMQYYINYLETQELATVQEVVVKAAKEKARVAGVLSSYGLSTPNQSREIHNDGSYLQGELKQHHNAMRLARFALNALMGRAGKPSLRLRKRTVSVPPQREIVELLTIAYHQRPEVAEALAAVQEHEAVKKEVLWAIPKINLRGTYGASDNRSNGGFFQGRTVGATFQTPLLLWPMIQATSDREEAFIQGLEMELGKIMGETTISVVQAYQHLQESLGMVNAAHERHLVKKKAWQALSSQQRYDRTASRLTAMDSYLDYLTFKKEKITREFSVQRRVLDLHLATSASFEDLEFTPVHPIPAETSESSFQKELKALWVQEPLWLSQEKEFLLNFFLARQITTLFIGVSEEQLNREETDITSFIQLLQAQDIQVQAFYQEPRWILPAHRLQAKQFFDHVIEFNRSHASVARFDAVHLDVGPHGLPSWSKAERSLLLGYLVTFLDWAHRYLQGHDMKLVVDIPDWYAENHDHLLAAISKNVDQLAIMTNVHTANVRSFLRDQSPAPRLTVWVGLNADSTVINRLRDTEGRYVESDFDSFVHHIHGSLFSRAQMGGIAINNLKRYQGLLLFPYFKIDDLMPIQSTKVY